MYSICNGINKGIIAKSEMIKLKIYAHTCLQYLCFIIYVWYKTEYYDTLRITKLRIKI